MPQKIKIMPAPPEHDSSVWFRILLDIVAAIAGLSAKLATLYAKDRLNWKEGLRNFCLAMLACFIVWNVCVANGINERNTAIFIAIAGHSSHAVIIITFKFLKNLVEKWDGDI